MALDSIPSVEYIPFVEYTKRERLDELFRRLAAAAAAGSFDEARALLDSTLNAVEDEMSGVPFNPETPLGDGRMYPPQDDYLFAVPDRPAIMRFRTRFHNIFIGSNGAIEIAVLKGARVFSKPGADGREVSEL